ncbi:class I SAM-dependent methyltransferase [Candidatus Roizmanbacteria bacterium]|nr:class I SAM-dependent methyltransferase [Candidatus Roizmanbacteria bacterium]
MKTKINKYIFTEDINYLKTDKISIWGKGDLKTLNILSKSEIKGIWLNLAAGDGRYNNILLNKADKVVAADIDGGALKKLYKNTPKDLQSKLETKILNMTERFSFGDNYFDGIFCTGTLYLFPKEILKKIFKEISRVLKKNGFLIFDFATDRKKVRLDGRKITDKRIVYKIESAGEMIKDLLPNYSHEIIRSKVPEELIKIGKRQYLFSCNFLLVKGVKLK